jgi:hypothetical protein
MMIQFQETYRFVEVILQIIGGGTVLKGVAWLYKRRKKSLENRVLDTFLSNVEDGPWQSANGVMGEMFLKSALNDARGFIPPRLPLAGWRAFKHWLWISPYRLRHAVRRFFLLPSKEQVDKILRELWERGLLVRAGWDHTDTEFYRMKN